MSTGITKTGYSAVFGGGKGYVNIGGWNSTLTDVSNTAKEVIGCIRWEGANKYMYAQIGTATAGSAGAFLALSTGYTDTNSIIAAFGLTANGVAATGTICRGVTVVSSETYSGPIYMWVLVEGFATGYAMTDSGLAYNALVGPSTSTANTLDAGVTAATAVGRVLGVSVATATAQVGSAGQLIYYKFKSMGGVYT